jgi:hypothetical protein
MFFVMWGTFLSATVSIISTSLTRLSITLSLRHHFTDLNQGFLYLEYNKHLNEDGDERAGALKQFQFHLGAVKGNKFTFEVHFC